MVFDYFRLNIVKGSIYNLLCSVCLSYKYVNLNKHIYSLIPKTICVQYLRILLRSVEKKIVKGLANRNQIFTFPPFSKFFQNVCRLNFHMILTNYEGLDLGNLLKCHLLVV